MKISVIIPALNEAGNIASTIRNVKNQPGEHEIIVVDGGSHDGTAALARSEAQVIFSDRGRGRQMNAGARRASGEALLFLHADSKLPRHAFTAVSWQSRTSPAALSLCSSIMITPC